MARRTRQAAPPPPPPPPEVVADPPAPLALPGRAEIAAPPEAGPDPVSSSPTPSTTASAAIAPPQPGAGMLGLPDQTAIILLGVAVGLAALASLFAWMTWRRGARGEEMIRASAEFTRSSLSVLAASVQHTERTIRDETQRMREESDGRGMNLRSEVRAQIGAVGDRLNTGLESTRGGVETRMDAFAKSQSEASEGLRFEVGRSVASFGEGLKTDMAVFQTTARDQLAAVEARIAALTEANEQRQTALRVAVEQRLEQLRANNDAKLEQMRATVEEKLQGTLEKRLGESFALVSERLESVQRGLGEMQTLALGVGDLKRVLTNVKTRGGWAEVQLGNLLGSILAPEQFATNVEVRAGSGERVEFTVLLPGDGEAPLHLPIDAKFPVEDYERLVQAQEVNDVAAVDAGIKGVEAAIKREAQRIATKYICPPSSTDYAFLYLPSEGLYAEVVRRPALIAEIQARHRVLIAGPTTLAALLNSLQMGFRSLAIQKRSGEVWRVLGEAKSEFEKYGAVWDKLKKQLETAQNTVEDAGRRTRAVTRKLRDVATVETGPAGLLEIEPADEDDTPPT